MTVIHEPVAKGGRTTFVAVQYLRAIAALLVVAIHLQEQLERVGWESHFVDYGSAGVDIFFVISGFVMWHTTSGTMSTSTFYYRRLVRIVPLYWLLTTLMLAVLVVAPQLLNTARFDIVHILASYFFIAQPHPVLEESIFPLLVPGWTLNYEMFFYALFGMMLLLKREYRLVGLVGLFAMLALFNLAVAPQPGVLAFYTDPILLEFAAGCLLGFGVERGATLRWSVGIAMAVVGAVLVIMHVDTIRILRDGVGAILIVSGIVLAEARRPAPIYKFPMLIGDVSYSLYLVHLLVLAALIKAFERVIGFGSASSAALYVAIAVPAVIVASIILYRGFEKPSLALLRNGLGSAKKLSRNW